MTALMVIVTYDDNKKAKKKERGAVKNLKEKHSPMARKEENYLRDLPR